MLTEVTVAPLAAALCSTASPFGSSPYCSTGSVYWICSGIGGFWAAAYCSVRAIAWLRRLMPAVLFSELDSTSMSSLVTPSVVITCS